MKDLEEFEQRLEDGSLEEEFKYAPEGRRFEILEVLEKLMDVADLADETATRIIFRGIRPVIRKQ